MTKQERMKLGRRKAYLERCIEAARLIDIYENETTVRIRIFNKEIRPVLRISYQAFNSMLNEPNPVKQLDEINQKLKNDTTNI